MKKLSLVVAVSTVALGAAVMAPVASTYASTIDTSDITNLVIHASNETDVCVSNGVTGGTITPATGCIADVWDEVRGYGLDVNDFGALVSYFGANEDATITIDGTIDDIRAMLVHMSDNAESAVPEIQTANLGMLAGLGSVDGLTLNISGNTQIKPNDLGYISYIAGLVKNPSQKLDVVVNGNVTFGAGEDDYLGETIADVAKSGSTLTATGTITLPNGTNDPTTFFGGAKVLAGNTIVAGNGDKYSVPKDGDYQKITVADRKKEDAPDTGVIGVSEGDATGSLTTVAAAMSAVTLAGAAVATKFRKN